MILRVLQNSVQIMHPKSYYKINSRIFGVSFFVIAGFCLALRVKAYLHSERFRLKFCQESVKLRGFQLCCFSRQNFKQNLWLLMLFHMILGQPPPRLTISIQYHNNIRSQGFHLKFCREKQDSQNPRNLTLSRQNFNPNLTKLRYALTCVFFRNIFQI